jgi:hypothetical protein
MHQAFLAYFPNALPLALLAPGGLLLRPAR